MFFLHQPMGNYSEQWLAGYHARRRQGRGLVNGENLLRSEPEPVRQTLEMELPLPISVNALYANVPGVGRVLTKKGREYKKSTVSLIEGYAMQQKFKTPAGKLSLSIVWYFKSELSDIDGPVKCLQDCLATALGFNDRRIRRLHLDAPEIDKQRPRCEVTLTVL